MRLSLLNFESIAILLFVNAQKIILNLLVVYILIFALIKVVYHSGAKKVYSNMINHLLQ